MNLTEVNQHHTNSDLALRVPFGLKNGKMYEPTQVKNGLACGCICPSCKRKLVAKANIADKKYDHSPHFAHDKNKGCVNGRETAIHLAAKQLIEEHGEIFLPVIEAKVELIDARRKVHPRSTLIRQEGIFKLQSVELEKSVGDFTPDLIAIDEYGAELLIEIAVTSFIDEHKLEKVKKYGRPLVEINASEVPIDNFEQLAQLLFEPVDVTKFEWKYHPDKAREELRLTEELNLLLEDIESKVKREDELQRWRQHNAEANRKFAQIKEQERLAEIEKERQEKADRFKGFSETKKLEVFLKFLKIDESKVPWFLNYKVSGEKSFSVTRKTWQVCIFGAFIQRSYGRRNEGFSAEQVVAWVDQRFIVTQEFKDSKKVAIWNFLSNLSRIGILEHTGRQWFDIHEDNLAILLARQISPPVDVSKINLNNIEWVFEWPSADFTARMAQRYERKHGKVCDWKRIAGLFSNASEKRVSEVVSRYFPAGNEELKKLVLEFMVDARFICLRK